MNIMITGAGSLGEAFIKTLYLNHKLTVVDNCEWTIARLQKQYPDVDFILGDFTSVDLSCFQKLIHTAAYKHINLGEENPNSFINNNINKTKELFEKAHYAHLDILFISTDKAVEPISLYGYTKAIGEHLARHYGGSVARLGNILSSSGSVIPVWEEAIATRKPIPITDEKMTRYFIEDSEAANQIWSMFCAGKKLIIPECREMRLLDLLTEVLKRHKIDTLDEYEPGIEIIGLRHREKLSEKLRWEDEWT